MNWDDFRFFLALAKTMTLKQSAKLLKVDQATVGRRIQALEEHLGAQVFEKSSDGHFLTSAGALILDRIEESERQFLSAHRLIAGQSEKVEGIVKIAMPGALANHAVIPALRDFVNLNPLIELNFITGPEVVNLSRREADIAVRLVRPDQRDLKIKKVGHLKLGLYVHHSLVPAKDLHPAVPYPFVGLFEYATSRAEKLFLKSVAPKPNYLLRTAAWSSVAIGIQNGCGQGILPTFMALPMKDLVLLREDPVEIPIWMVIHPEVANSARIRAVSVMLTQVFSTSVFGGKGQKGST